MHVSCTYMYVTASFCFIVLCSTDFPLENGRYELEFSEDSIDYKMSITCNRGYTGNNLRDEYTCSDGNWSPTPRSAQCVGK